MERSSNIELCRASFPMFAGAMREELHLTPMHITYYTILEAFARGMVRRLIISMPPQHGKSEGSTRLLPAYLLGINPDLRIAVASYSDTFAKKFNREIQRIIDTPEYQAIFPDTALNRSNVVSVTSNHLRNASEFEIVGHAGGLKVVGRGGGLTGNRVDIMILDDLYKDAMEGNSPTIRDAVYEWYTSVVRTRQHNNSQELIVFTRWHEEDLIGEILKREPYVEIKSLTDLRGIPPRTWAYLNFEAIKENEPTEIDPRQPGEPLWAERHSLEALNERRAFDPHTFEALYQGHPTSKFGLLYGAWQTYSELPKEIVRYANYTDTADTGDDYLCSICYVVGKDGNCYVTDVLFTKESMEVTEEATAMLLTRNNTRVAYIESNNGGRSFARTIQRLAPRVKVEWFHQSGNKESRILSNSATAQHNIFMPADWSVRFPEFFHHLTTFRRSFKANAHDDGADAITGIAEREYQTKKRVSVYSGYGK